MTSLCECGTQTEKKYPEVSTQTDPDLYLQDIKPPDKDSSLHDEESSKDIAILSENGSDAADPQRPDMSSKDLLTHHLKKFRIYSKEKISK